MKQTISVKELFLYGWTKTKQHFWFVVAVAFVSFFITSIAQAILDNKHDNDFGSFVIQIGLIAIHVLLSIGGLHVFLKLSKNETAEFKDLFTHYYLMWKFFLGQLLANIIVAIGIVLLIVPGIMWAMKYMFVPILIVDKHMKPIEALKQSGRMTYGYKWDLFRLSLVMLLFNIAGIVAFGIGIFVTIPVSVFIYTRVYHMLLGAGNEALVTTPAAV